MTSFLLNCFDFKNEILGETGEEKCNMVDFVFVHLVKSFPEVAAKSYVKLESGLQSKKKRERER